jgi:hypothetical protein
MPVRADGENAILWHRCSLGSGESSIRLNVKGDPDQCLYSSSTTASVGSGS